ncbi:MAG: DUF1145 domain-containing protein [Deltaproteobacteria bacterium]|nr:DUF1145 domain-containing protein [Deltaproteobacteria bacterium]MBW2420430.1 DUF1145 domain-containing protein [Deltaproteobacteria bacterium]
MSARTLKIAKIVTAATWILLAGALFCPHDSTLLQALRLGFWVLLGVHAVECLIFLPTLRASGKPLPGQIFQVLLFGVIHYKTLRQEESG